MNALVASLLLLSAPAAFALRGPVDADVPLAERPHPKVHVALRVDLARDPFARALMSRVRDTFFWVRALSQPAVPVCDVRVGQPVSVAWNPHNYRHAPPPSAGFSGPGETGEQIALRLGVPYWAIERLNPGRDLSFVRPGESVRVPAVRGSVARRCYNPTRDWVSRSS